MALPDVRVLIVDDHHVVRLGLRALLEGEPGLEVVGEAADGEQALSATERLRPDVVVMDVRLPGRSGTDVCGEIVRRWPQTHVIMLTSYLDEDLVLQALMAGAEGYVLKQLEGDALLKAIQAVARGDAVLDAATMRRLVARVRRAEGDSDRAAFRDLSERELSVLRLIAEGMTNAEIARVLSLSEKTVGNHVSTILGKLGLNNRIQAATHAVRHHIERHAPGPA
ncbi:response regulator [Limnochorda pilosa]|uniref:LuxR family transcriptional regulator n=1 Tax=Limnochorda pilosa TaxID=1555112 RepID=A0A0K2SJ90_LIMPI|nr:response regulator transcription factor [Limnochorda pilosa]BAS26919.1 LuxR family transcriptional regulator [Limnochorda pilosa]